MSSLTEKYKYLYELSEFVDGKDAKGKEEEYITEYLSGLRNGSSKLTKPIQ